MSADLTTQGEKDAAAAKLALDKRVEHVAFVCHETNRAYCTTLGDDSQRPWQDAPGWQQESARAGVRGIHEGRIKTPMDSHASWSDEKIADGWTFGVTKDPIAKTHPCLVPFAQLPPAQQAKDRLFFAVATALLAD